MQKTAISEYSSKSLMLYFLILALVSATFATHILPVHWMVSGAIQYLFFFIALKLFSEMWINLDERRFLKNVFVTAFVIRLVYVVVMYALYIYWTGEPFEFEAADAHFYDEVGSSVSNIGLLKAFAFADANGVEYSDMGHPIFVAIVYSLFGHNVIVVRIFHALISAYMCILIYRLTARNFGEMPARYAAIIAMLFHNFIYYCGLHLKETNMIFLTVLFLERADYALRGQKLTFSSMVIPILSGVLVFFFRTVLGAVLWMAFFGAILLSKDRIMSTGRRIFIGFLMALSAATMFSGRIEGEVKAYWEARNTNQSTSMEWRSMREGGNKLAKYGSATLFAPAIFIIPIPTMVDIDNQQNQMFQNGGFLEKDVLSFFVYIALSALIFRYKSWRRHLLILLFIAGYLTVIAMSAFAMSERFHLPAMPVFVMLAAFGITQVTKRQKKYFPIYLFILGFVVLAWNWFKLAGRGLI